VSSVYCLGVKLELVVDTYKPCKKHARLILKQVTSYDKYDKRSVNSVTLSQWSHFHSTAPLYVLQLST
jgi:hypothetical protein